MLRHMQRWTRTYGKEEGRDEGEKGSERGDTIIGSAFRPHDSEGLGNVRDKK